LPGVEIIQRDACIFNEGTNGEELYLKINKSQLQGEKVQVSYNSYKHLTIRLITGDSDKLIVFDKSASEEIIDFLKDRNRDLPF